MSSSTSRRVPPLLTVARHERAAGLKALRAAAALGLLLVAALQSACLNSGSNGTGGTGAVPPPVVNTTTLTVDSGPAAAPGAINHAYVTVHVCAPGSQTQCADIDHVLLDTGSTGLRLVRSVLTAHGISLSGATDASGHALEECVRFGGGDTWGPIAAADVAIAGETAAGVPVQVMDDTAAGAAPPATCGAGGTLINGVTGFFANGVLGVGVFAQDCGQACVSAATPLPVYYGCPSTGACAAENVALSGQVANVVAKFAADNNGVIVDLPNLINANGDASVQGELIFGIATQADNALPLSGLTVLGTDANGYFTTTYKGAVLPSSIDSGTNAYFFDDPTIALCVGGQYSGDYCPAVAPQSASALLAGVGANNASSTVDFAIADPNNTFVPNVAAYVNLAAGAGSSRFIWGMPFFYGRKVYVGIEQRVAGSYGGPFFAY